MNWAECLLIAFITFAVAQLVRDYQCGRDTKKEMWSGLIGVAIIATLMWFAGLFH